MEPKKVTPRKQIKFLEEACADLRNVNLELRIQADEWKTAYDAIRHANHNDARNAQNEVIRYGDDNRQLRKMLTAAEQAIEEWKHAHKRANQQSMRNHRLLLEMRRDMKAVSDLFNRMVGRVDKRGNVK